MATTVAQFFQAFVPCAYAAVYQTANTVNRNGGTGGYCFAATSEAEPRLHSCPLTLALVLALISVIETLPERGVTYFIEN